jgi:peptidoglycan/xylan/chitin deacetylase (PgdA/CDA1 family)
MPTRHTHARQRTARAARGQVLAARCLRPRVVLASEATAATPAPTTVELSPTRDTYTQRYYPTTPKGSDNNLRLCAPADTYGGTGLLFFDLSGLPTGAIITEATLTLTLLLTSTGAVTVTVYPILAADTAWDTNATWNTPDGSNPWAGDTGADGGADAGCSVAGTDYGSSIGSFAIGATDPDGTAYVVDLDTDALQAMIAANHGLVLISNSASARYVGSQDHATAAYRPVLSLTYVNPGRVVILFADGRLTDLTLAAPLLSRRGLPWISFLMPGQVGTGAKMDESEIAALAALGGVPASHGYTHEDPTLMDEPTLAIHLEDSRAWLVARSYAGADWYAPPIADNAAVRDAALAAGYTVVLTYALDEFAVLPAGYTYYWQEGQDAVGWGTIQAALAALSGGDVLFLQFHRTVETGPVSLDVSTARLTAILNEIETLGLLAVTLSDL